VISKPPLRPNSCVGARDSILDISMGMPPVFENPYTSKFRNISSKKMFN